MQPAPSQVASVIARWHSDMVPADAAAFTREVVARAAPATKARAKALLFAASRAASFAAGTGLELRAEVVFCPAVIERFIVASARAFSAPTARRCAPTAAPRPGAGHPEPAPVRLPRERAKKPYTAEEISAYLGGRRPTDAGPGYARPGGRLPGRGPAWWAPSSAPCGA